MSLPTDFESRRIDDRWSGRRVDKRPINFGAADRLTDYAGYKYFSLAIPYLFGKFGDEQLARFEDELQRPVLWLYRLFSQPIFVGLDIAGDPSWNHALFAIPESDWSAFEAYMLSVVVVCRDTKQTYGVGARDWDIVDPLFQERRVVLPAELPLHRITVFGVNGSRKCLSVAAGKELPIPRLHLVEYPPQPLAVKYANTLFDNRNPVAGTQSFHEGVYVENRDEVVEFDLGEDYSAGRREHRDS